MTVMKKLIIISLVFALFGFASKKYHPIKDLDAKRWKALGLKTKYYNTNLHIGSFALPNYVEDLLKDVEYID